MKRLALVLLLLAAPAFAAAPCTITQRDGLGHPLTAAEFDANMDCLINLWTVTATNSSAGTLEPLWSFANTDTGTTTKTLLSLKRGSVASVVFTVGDDRAMYFKENDGTTTAFTLVYNPGDPTVYVGAEGVTNALELYAGSGADVKLTQADGTVVTNGGIRLVGTASPPYTCDAAHRGSIYYDTSDDDLCRCKGAGPAWASFGAGSCS